MKKKCDRRTSGKEAGNTRHVAASSILLDLNMAPRGCSLGSSRFEHCTASIDLGSTTRITGCTVTLEATLPIFIDQDLRYLKLVSLRRYKIVRFKNSIILVQY